MEEERKGRRGRREEKKGREIGKRSGAERERASKWERERESKGIYQSKGMEEGMEGYTSRWGTETVMERG